MHPSANIRATASRHLSGRTIVLAVTGSIAAVKTVELARELLRHGADVVPVMSDAATRILHPDALEFATGHKPITKLTGATEHISILGDVPGRADLLLVAPATANTVSKMALGIDDTPVTTFATVAFGGGVPVVVAPAMHEGMLAHPLMAAHARTLRDKLGVTWVEPTHDEKKAKLADVEAIVEAVIHRLANDSRRPGPLAGQHVLVISGSTAEPLDPVRIVANRSSGRSGHVIATELHRLGAAVDLWEGHVTEAAPSHLAGSTTRFDTHADLMALVKRTALGRFDEVWMPAAIGDYTPQAAKHKIASGKGPIAVTMKPLGKVIDAVRRKAPKAVLVGFKAESERASLLPRARERLTRYKAQFIVANASDAFGAATSTVHLIGAGGEASTFSGPKEETLAAVVQAVASSQVAARGRRKAR
ncbi:MAG: bifunctional phosphopantothenoylcysteine decarboxylase/phosphopantothenate--cysteine ligase CoaBC [bacterium]